MRLKENKGMTLIALIVTIIILIILASVGIKLVFGNSAIISRAKQSKNQYEEQEAKEVMELKITNIQISSYKENRELPNLQYLVDKLYEDEEIEYIVTESREYENSEKIDVTNEESIFTKLKMYPYEFEIQNDLQIIDIIYLDDEARKYRPTGKIEILTQDQDLLEVQIKVVATTKDEQGINTIEPVGTAELVSDISNQEKVFKVKENGVHKFKIVGNNGKNTIIKTTVSNIILTSDSLFDAITEINTEGIKKVRNLNTKNNTDSILLLNVIQYDNGLTLDGTNAVKGASLASKVYKFGNASTDVNKNILVLKVQGDITINSGVTLTTVDNGTYGPKGIILYCTGNLINNGSINMAGKGSSAAGQNMSLLKNSNDTYEVIKASGGAAGSAIAYNSSSKLTAGNGGSGYTNDSAGGGGRNE